MQPAIAENTGLGFELQRRFRASPERIFNAWTQPKALREWWCPSGWQAGEIEIDLCIGGTYRIDMNRSGTIGAGVSVVGRFVEIQPPNRLVYTWQWEGAFAAMPETLVTLELQGTSDETLLTIRHDGFGESGTRQQHRSGWMTACDRLDQTLGEPAQPLRKSAVH